MIAGRMGKVDRGVCVTDRMFENKQAEKNVLEEIYMKNRTKWFVVILSHLVALYAEIFSTNELYISKFLSISLQITFADLPTHTLLCNQLQQIAHTKFGDPTPT